MINDYLTYISQCTKLADYHKTYHLEGISPIPDEEYDTLRKEVMKWEKENPDSTLDLSPVYKVGAARSENKKEELRHEYKMLSLENALTEEEATSWVNTWIAKYGTDVDVIGEFKYDGMAISALYIDGKFIRALTRGDGEYGEDITHHAVHFLPVEINATGMVEIRGEALVDKQWLAWMNANGETFANARNCVAGMLNRKEAHGFDKGITFVAYDIEGPDFVFNRYSDKLLSLKQLGFSMLSCFNATPETIQTFFDRVHDIRTSGSLSFDIDGMVFKIDDTKKQLELGETEHSPNWAFAYKFPPVIGVCQVLDVVFQVGRTGEVCPVAKITATPLMGVVVTSVTLHNEERMFERNIAIGNSYQVWRSGDVIPHMGKVVETVPDARVVSFPKECPSCGSPLVKHGAIYYCENSSECIDQLKSGIAYAVSRDVLDVDGLAEQTIVMMLKSKLITCVADIFKLDTKDIATLDGYTEYSAGKLESAIWTARKTTFDRFIMALGIMDVGKSTSRKLAQRIFKHQVLFDLNTPEKVLELRVPDVGPSTAANMADYFSDPKKRQDAIELYNRLSIAEMGQPELIAGVTNKTFVFTGSFSDTREAYENKVLSAGGLISSSISSKTDYCVAGDRPGSKFRKANLLGVEIIDERVFLSLFVRREE
jgi:DNA ligase (NAD+)